mgnify:FL=1
MLQDSFFYTGARGAWFGDGSPWTLATIVFAVAFAVVGAMSHWLDYSLLDPRVLLGTLICLIAGGAFIWLACGRLAPDDGRMGLMLAGSLIVGVATPLYYMEMVRQLLPMRLAHIIVVCSACTVLASLLYTLLMLVAGPAVVAAIVMLPVGMFATLWPSRREFSPRPRQQRARLYIPWKLNVTAFAQGMGYEAGFALCAQLNSSIPGAVHSLTYVAGYAFAAVVLAASATLLRRRFDTLIYKIGFPVLALGTLLVPVASASGVSCFLAAWGYRFIDILMWSLVIYLAVSKKVTVNWMTGWSTCFFYLGMAAGQAFTLGMLALCGPASGQLAMGLASCIVLIVGLYVTDTSNDERAWGTLRPDGGNPRPFYSEAVNAVALRYGLTARQIDVLALLGKGGTKREIAEELGISHETVKVHVRNVYAALDVHSQEALCTILAAQEQVLDQQAG